MVKCMHDKHGICKNRLRIGFGEACILHVMSNPEPTDCDAFFEVNEEIEPATSSDPVNHPNHYTRGGIECIKAIEASMTPEEFQGYCKGNVEKYIWRWREKNGLEDLKKAKVYLDWMIESVEKNSK